LNGTSAPTYKVNTYKLDLERLSAFPNQPIWISSIAFNYTFDFLIPLTRNCFTPAHD